MFPRAFYFENKISMKRSLLYVNSMYKLNYMATYNLLVKLSPVTLAQEVNALLAEGFELHGSPIVTTVIQDIDGKPGEATHYFQAMTKAS
jgi:hypothetical protein